MSDDYEDEGQQVTYVQPPPHKFSGWNVAGIALTTVAGLLGVLNQGLNMVAQECWTMAHWREQRRIRNEAKIAHEEEQRRQAEALEHQLGLDRYWVEPEGDR